MATKTHMVTCRLDDRDYGSLHENAAASTSPRRPICATSSASQYRHAQTKGIKGACHRREDARRPALRARPLGTPLQSGVHALNAIVYAARRKAPERDYFVQQIAVANEKLDAVEEGRRRLEGRLDGLEGSIVVATPHADTEADIRAHGLPQRPEIP